MARHRISNPMAQTSKARDIKDKNLSLTCKSLQSRFRLTRYEHNNALLSVLAAPCPCCSFIAADVSLVCSYSKMWYNCHQRQLSVLKCLKNQPIELVDWFAGGCYARKTGSAKGSSSATGQGSRGGEAKKAADKLTQEEDQIWTANHEASDRQVAGDTTAVKSHLLCPRCHNLWIFCLQLTFRFPVPIFYLMPFIIVLQLFAMLSATYTLYSTRHMFLRGFLSPTSFEWSAHAKWT